MTIDIIYVGWFALAIVGTLVVCAIDALRWHWAGRAQRTND